MSRKVKCECGARFKKIYKTGLTTAFGGSIYKTTEGFSHILGYTCPGCSYGWEPVFFSELSPREQEAIEHDYLRHLRRYHQFLAGASE